MRPMRVLITRPEEDAAPLAAALGERGIEVVVAPLMEIVYSDGPPLDVAGVQALLASSANGVRAFARRSPRRDVHVYAVGDATARAAADAGFADIEGASGDVDALADLVCQRADPAAGVLLHVAGTAVAGDLGGRLASAGFEVRRVVLYEAKTASRLPETIRTSLETQAVDGVALYSPRTATTFVRLVADAGLADRCQSLIGFCLSNAVAHAVRDLAWRRISVAHQPDQRAMIALIAEASSQPG